MDLAPGDHTIGIQFLGDRITTTCDRNLHVDRIDLSSVGGAPDPITELAAFEMETLPGVSPTGSIRPVDVAGASGGRAARFMRNGMLGLNASLSGPAAALRIRASGEPCEGDPILVVMRGTAEILRTRVPAGTPPQDVVSGVGLPAGTTGMRVGYVNDLQRTTCDRNLVVDDFRLYATRPVIPWAP